jgi:hypothetical protein
MPNTFGAGRLACVALVASTLACAVGSTGEGAFVSVADGGAAVPSSGSASVDASLPPPPSYGSPDDADTTNEDATLAEGDGAIETGTPEAFASGEDDAGDGGQAGEDGAVGIPGVVVPSLGDLLVTEVMFDPSGAQPQSQWFEIHNVARSPELLSGLAIEDQNGTVAVIASSPPVVAPALSYIVLVRDRATALANAIPSGSIVYDYGAGVADDAGVHLASDVTGELSLWQASLELADVPYGLWGMDAPGQSVELGPQQLVGADQPWNWCLASNAWAGASDQGTPGQPNDCP